MRAAHRAMKLAIVDLRGGQQGAVSPGMAGLRAAALAAGWTRGPAGGGRGVSGRRAGRVAGVLAQPGGEIGNLGLEGLHLREQAVHEGLPGGGHSGPEGGVTGFGTGQLVHTP